MKTITIRLSDELGQALSDAAWQARTSVNRYVAQAIEARVNAEADRPGELAIPYGNARRTDGSLAFDQDGLDSFYATHPAD